MGAGTASVTARFSDGRTEDFTRDVVYSSNDTDVASVGADGIVTAKRRGETAILIRAAGHAAAATVGVVGPPLSHYPQVPRTNFIDEAVFTKLKRLHIVPSDLADDAEFLRRVCLDLAGTLPPPARLREFLASRDPRKREKVVDALIGSSEFVDYWTFRFSDVFRVSIFANGLTPKWSQGYWEDPLRDRDQPALQRDRARAALGARLRSGVAPLPPVQPDRAARGRHGRGGPGLLRAAARLCAVPQSPVRELDPGPVLGHVGLLRTSVQDGSGRLRPSR